MSHSYRLIVTWPDRVGIVAEVSGFIARQGHCHTIEDLVRFGRDVAKTVLARGLRWHLQDRILIHGN